MPSYYESVVGMIHESPAIKKFPFVGGGAYDAL